MNAAGDLDPAAPDRDEPVCPPCPVGPSPTGLGWSVVTTRSCLHGCCPYAAELGGIPGPVPGDRLLSHAPPRQAGQSFWGGTRFTGSPPGRELHPHGCRVIRGPLASATVTQVLVGLGCQSTDRSRSTTQ